MKWIFVTIPNDKKLHPELHIFAILFEQTKMSNTGFYNVRSQYSVFFANSSL